MSLKKNLKVVGSTGDECWDNCIYFSPGEFESSPCYLKTGIKSQQVYCAKAHKKISSGCISMNKTQRIITKCFANRIWSFEIFKPPTINFDIDTLTLDVKYRREFSGWLPDYIDKDKLSDVILKELFNHVVSIDQDIPIIYITIFIITVKDIEITNKEDIKRGKITKDTKLELCIAKSRGFKLKFK